MLIALVPPDCHFDSATDSSVRRWFRERLDFRKVSRLGALPRINRPVLNDCFNHGQPLPLGQVDGVAVELYDSGAVHFLRDEGDQLFGESHQVVVVRVGLVELQHGELGVVLGAYAFVAEVAIDFVDAVEAADYEPLEVKLGRDAQEEVHVERVVVGGEGTRCCAAGDGLHHRGFDFEIAAGVEVAADGFEDLGALDEDFAGVEVGEEIDVALAVAEFDVGEAVVLLRQGEHGLGKEGQRLDVDGEFAGAGAEEIAGDADVVAHVE